MKKIELLREDYKDALAFVDKCDEHIFKIRNWALLSASAVIAFALTSKTDEIVLVNIIVVLCFLYFELIYKSLQNDAARYANSIAVRIQCYIEKSDSKKYLKDYEYGFGKSLRYPSVKRAIETIYSPVQRHILTFYSLLIVCSLGTLILDFYFVE